MHWDLTGIGTLALVALGIAANLLLSARSNGSNEQLIKDVRDDVKDIKADVSKLRDEAVSTGKIVAVHEALLNPPRVNGHGRLHP